MYVCSSKYIGARMKNYRFHAISLISPYCLHFNTCSYLCWCSHLLANLWHSDKRLLLLATIISGSHCNDKMCLNPRVENVDLVLATLEDQLSAIFPMSGIRTTHRLAITRKNDNTYFKNFVWCALTQLYKGPPATRRNWETQLRCNPGLYCNLLRSRLQYHWLRVSCY